MRGRLFIFLYVSPSFVLTLTHKDGWKMPAQQKKKCPRIVTEEEDLSPHKNSNTRIHTHTFASLTLTPTLT